MSENDQYAGFREEPSANLMAVLDTLADEYLQAEKDVVDAQFALEIAKAAMKEIAEDRIPKATDGLEGTFNLPSKRKLVLKEEIRSSIAGDKRLPAIEWLDANDHGHIVKREITFEFPRGQEELAAQFVEEINEIRKRIPELKNIAMKFNDTVHHATLNFWVKEQLADGVDLPFDIFGIYRQRTAKVKEE